MLRHFVLLLHHNRVNFVPIDTLHLRSLGSNAFSAQNGI